MSQSTDLIPFTTPDGSSMRVAMRAGAPWFVAADACRALEHSNTSMAVKTLDPDDRVTVLKTDIPNLKWDSPQPQVVLVSEPGLYALIFASRAAGALRFQRWVTREVLPQIRRTGSYHPAVPTSFADALELAARQAREIEQAQRTIGEQRQVLDWAEPRAQYVDAFVNGAEDATKIRDLAAQLNIQEKTFRAWLTARRLAYKDAGDGQWKAYAQPATSPRRHWFVLRDQPEAPRLHNGQMKKTLYVTPAGKAGIAGLLERNPT